MATARPMPEAPPVMATILPDRFDQLMFGEDKEKSGKVEWVWESVAGVEGALDVAGPDLAVSTEDFGSSFEGGLHLTFGLFGDEDEGL